jgi:hypothetical protein
MPLREEELASFHVGAILIGRELSLDFNVNLELRDIGFGTK